MFENKTDHPVGRKETIFPIAEDRRITFKENKALEIYSDRDWKIKDYGI